MPFSLQRSELTKKLVSTSSKAGIPYPMLTLVLLLSIPSESGITTVLIIACVAFAILAGLRLRLGQDISKSRKQRFRFAANTPTGRPCLRPVCFGVL